MVPYVEIAALIVSLVALGVSFVTAGYTRRKTLAAEDSAADARRSADAAQEAISYQRDELEREQRVRRVPPAELLDLLLRLRKDLGDILTAGGMESLWFLDPHRQDAHTRLAGPGRADH